MEQFTNTISIQDWQPVLDSENAQKAYTIMSLKLCKIFNDAFPLRTIKVKNEQYKKLWMRWGIA